MTVVCPIARCRTENEPTAGSCRRCGTPLQAYVRLSAHAARLFNEGLAAARTGDHATARDRFAAIVHWYPDDMEAHNALALACYHLGAHTEAHHHWHLALTRDPDDPVARRGVAHLTAAAGLGQPEPPEPAAVSPGDSAAPE
ncbi:tetratricopeptide repeat protein [Streptomyces spinosirectus]